ncbi:KxYKxGKxW signal peptide domain-containing protein [Fructilactobacillus florum]|uniref:KxYKxGKxW signal peptide domain-containing protein n=1 Tax=Fructilactobacillus florum TaxID=640331 RepID=UPI0006D15421|nr:KxYKxGKxW signal peptide domain-containing protein [Fructilactobacillus florum]
MFSDNREKKTRFKMYKAGKVWVVAGATFVTLLGLGNLASHADDSNPTNKIQPAQVTTPKGEAVASNQPATAQVVSEQQSTSSTSKQTSDDLASQTSAPAEQKNAGITCT